MISLLQEFQEDEIPCIDVRASRQRDRGTLLVKRRKLSPVKTVVEETGVINDPSKLEVDKVANYRKMIEIVTSEWQKHQEKLLEFCIIRNQKVTSLKKEKKKKKEKKASTKRREMGFSLSNTDYMRKDSELERHSTVGDVSSVLSFLQVKQLKTKQEDFSTARDMIQQEVNPSIDAFSFLASNLDFEARKTINVSSVESFFEVEENSNPETEVVQKIELPLPPAIPILRKPSP